MRNYQREELTNEVREFPRCLATSFAGVTSQKDDGFHTFKQKRCWLFPDPLHGSLTALKSCIRRYTTGLELSWLSSSIRGVFCIKDVIMVGQIFGSKGTEGYETLTTVTNSNHTGSEKKTFLVQWHFKQVKQLVQGELKNSSNIPTFIEVNPWKFGVYSSGFQRYNSGFS